MHTKDFCMCFAGNRDGEHDAGCGNEACILHLRKAHAEPHHRFPSPTIDFRSAFYE